jgi:hypothetical protein
MSRVILTIVLEVVLAILLSLVLAGVWFLFLGETLADAFFGDGFGLLFTFMDVGLIAWLLLLILGGVRRRGLGWGVGGSILAAFIAVIVNLIVVTIVAMVQGGANIFYIALGIEAGIVFLIAAPIAVLIVQRLVKPASTVAATT